MRIIKDTIDMNYKIADIWIDMNYKIAEIKCRKCSCSVAFWTSIEKMQSTYCPVGISIKSFIN